jgi:hypothetical protein
MINISSKQSSEFERTGSVPDLPLCLGVFRHRGTNLPVKIFLTMDFGLYGAILNLKAFCFGAIPDIMIELIVYLLQAPSKGLHNLTSIWPHLS